MVIPYGRVCFGTNLNDNAENYRFGLKYSWRSILVVRSGMRLNVRGQPYPTFGFSVRSLMGMHPLYLDYAVNPTDLLGFRNTSDCASAS